MKEGIGDQQPLSRAHDMCLSQCTLIHLSPTPYLIVAIMCKSLLKAPECTC
jgi:hypothetical protein